jgi:hypothetical protein
VRALPSDGIYLDSNLSGAERSVSRLCGQSSTIDQHLARVCALRGIAVQTFLGSGHKRQSNTLKMPSHHSSSDPNSMIRLRLPRTSAARAFLNPWGKASKAPSAPKRRGLSQNVRLAVLERSSIRCARGRVFGREATLTQDAAEAVTGKAAGCPGRAAARPDARRVGGVLRDRGHRRRCGRHRQSASASAPVIRPL